MNFVKLMTPTITDSDIERAVSRLVSVTERDQAYFVHLPFMRPEGSAVSVRVVKRGDVFVISDFAAGYREADLAGCAHTYRRVSKVVAEAYGLSLDDHFELTARVSPSQIAGMIGIVGGAALEIAQKVHETAYDWDAADASEGLLTRLVGLFGNDAVVARADIVGASNVSWPVTAKVVIEGRQIAFDLVSNHHASVFSTVAKFNDLARLEDAPKRVVAVEHRKDMGKWLPLLSQTATVIDEETPDLTIEKIAA